MEWRQVFDNVRCSILKIETPQGQGTGFLCRLDGRRLAIATAYHVAERAAVWEETIHVTKHDGSLVKLRWGDFDIWSEPRVDAALIIYDPPKSRSSIPNTISLSPTPITLLQ